MNDIDNLSEYYVHYICWKKRASLESRGPAWKCRCGYFDLCCSGSSSSQRGQSQSYQSAFIPSFAFAHTHARMYTFRHTHTHTPFSFVHEHTKTDTRTKEGEAPNLTDERTDRQVAGTQTHMINSVTNYQRQHQGSLLAWSYTHTLAQTHTHTDGSGKRMRREGEKRHAQQTRGHNSQTDGRTHRQSPVKFSYTDHDRNTATADQRWLAGWRCSSSSGSQQGQRQPRQRQRQQRRRRRRRQQPICGKSQKSYRTRALILATNRALFTGPAPSPQSS